MCTALAQETFRVGARAAAASSGRVSFQAVVFSRLGQLTAEEANAWETVLGRCAAEGAPAPPLKALRGIEDIALVSVSASPAVPLAPSCDPPSGGYLLQKGAKDNPGPGVETGRQLHLVWFPPAPPCAALIPGEADACRTTHVQVHKHLRPQDECRSSHTTSPTMPTTPTTNGAANGEPQSKSLQEEECPARSLSIEGLMSEFHQLQVLNAAFHGMCIGRPISSGAAEHRAWELPGAGAHLPLHCCVARRLWALACGAEHWSHRLQEKRQ